MEQEVDQIEGHYIVCGFGRVGRQVVENLRLRQSVGGRGAAPMLPLTGKVRQGRHGSEATLLISERSAAAGPLTRRDPLRQGTSCPAILRAPSHPQSDD
jgi:hypothetical protein